VVSVKRAGPCVIVIKTASVAESAAVLALLKASHEYLQHLRTGVPALAIELSDQQLLLHCAIALSDEVVRPGNAHPVYKICIVLLTVSC